MLSVFGAFVKCDDKKLNKIMIPEWELLSFIW